ncbi:hypothetical protein PILCRDRAFT_820443 [Piloderma croceum F 1598]|uniref:Uncharacterized protein n=1 Tax=Piloderma croceum (strain F 1598) TaxID=765440 RepID=A0A0C3BYW7_PILCF|nr:hypothetical protein PILCRDRAFT_820443 [Piloderma croceum F 1598]
MHHSESFTGAPPLSPSGTPVLSERFAFMHQGSCNSQSSHSSRAFPGQLLSLLAKMKFSFSFIVLAVGRLVAATLAPVVCMINYMWSPH